MLLTNKLKHRRLFSMMAAFLLPLLLVVVIFDITYRLDNKYQVESGEITALVDEWEYYPGQLLSPAEIEGGDYHAVSVFIGQTSSFSDDKGLPFGSATYRKVLNLPKKKQGWMLELPEVYSACKVFINGEAACEIGNLLPEFYQPKTQNVLLALPSGQVELVIQATNYSHYYSGMIYPPLLGVGDNLVKNTVGRLLLYALLSFFTLGGAVISIGFWMRRKGQQIFLLYGLLSLFFSLHMLYPFAHWLGWGRGEVLYVLEDMLYFAQVGCMVLITTELTRHQIPRWLHLCAYVSSSIMVLLPICCTYILFPSFPGGVWIYGEIVTCFKIMMSLYLIGVSFAAALRGGGEIGLLAGNAVFGLGILADYWTAGAFEPIRFAWQDEYCSFLMVLLFTVLIVRYGYQIMRENDRLTKHLQEEVDKKTQRLAGMLEERKQFLSAVAHDLKAPAAVIRMYAGQLREKGTSIHANEWLEVIDRKSELIQENVQSLQVFNVEDRSREPMTEIDGAEFFREVYEETIPYAEANGIYYNFVPEQCGYLIRCQPKRLFLALENIILNATEHTQLSGMLTFTWRFADGEIEVILADTGEGIEEEKLEHIFEYRYSTKEQGGLRGLGLYFTKVTIEEFGGSIVVESVVGKGTEFHVFLPAQKIPLG